METTMETDEEKIAKLRDALEAIRQMAKESRYPYGVEGAPGEDFAEIEALARRTLYGA